MPDQTLRYNIVVDASSVEKSINGVIADLQAAEKNALKLSNAVLNSFEENAHKSTDAVNASTTKIKREIQDATKDMKAQYAANFTALKKQIADLSGEKVSDSMRAKLNQLLEDTKEVMQRTATSMSRIGADYSKEVERQFKEYKEQSKSAADARLADEKRAEEVVIAYAQYEQEQTRQTLQQIEDCYRERDQLREQELSAEVQHIEEVNKYEREQVAEQERLSKEGLKQVLDKNKEILDDEKKRAKEEERLAKEAAKADAKAQKEREKAQKDAEKARIQALKDEDNAWKNLASTISTVIAAVGAVKLSKEFIQSASDAERALFGLGKIFGDVRDEAQALSETLADMYAMSKTESAQALVGASKMLDAFGLEDEVLLSLSSNLVGLSADLSAFTGGMISAETAMTSLQSALMGNYRTLKETFRVGISSDAIDKIAKRWGLMSENLSDAQKVLLRYQAIIEATENVNGSFAESQDSLYVTQQELKASWEDLKISLGEQLLPVVTDFLNVVNSLVEGVDNLGPAFKGFVAGSFGLLALISIVPKVIAAVAKLTAALRALGVAESFAQGGVIGLVAALGALAVTAVVAAISNTVDATDKVADSTKAATTAAEEYAAAAEREKKASNDLTRALEEQAKMRARDDAVMEAQSALSAYGTTGKTLGNKSTALSKSKEEAQYYIDRLNRLDKDSPLYAETLGLLNNYNTLVLSAAQDEFDEVSAQFIKETQDLAQMYAKMKMNNEDGFFDDILATIKAAVAPNAIPLFTDEVNKALAAARGFNTDVKSLVQGMQFNEQDWAKMLETAAAKLTSSQQALEKASDEYKKIRDSAREALGKEYNGYVNEIEQRLNVLQDTLDTEVEGTEAYTKTKEEIDRLEEQKEQAKKWYDDMYEYYGNVYDKNVMDAAEKLETKLAALVYKREQTLKEQEEQTVSDLESKWKDYAKTFNASIGGSTNIGSVGSERSSLDAYIESIKGMEGVTEETITALTIAWETYYGSLNDISEYYERMRADKMRELQDALLATELAATNLSEQEQYSLQMRQLQRQHDAELEELAREYKDAEEYEKMKALLEERQRKEDENAEREHQKRLTEIIISEATARVQRIASAVSSTNLSTSAANKVKGAGHNALADAMTNGNRESTARFTNLGYDAQTAAAMQAVVLDAESKILSATTDDEIDAITENMYAELYNLAVEYSDKLDDLRDKIREEALNDVELTYKARQELEMQNLEDEKKEALGKIADKNSDMYKLTEEWYNKRINNLTKKQADDAEKITREQNKALVASQKELLYDKEALYEADKTALEEELAYELAQADKNGKDKVLIEAMYNNKLEKLRRDHYVEMASITRQYEEELLGAQINNNAARGGWFDLVSNAYDRRLQSRKQTAMGLTDYVGGIEGINTEAFQNNASAFDNMFNTMLRKSLIIGSEKDKAEREAELKEQFRGMLDEVEYAGDDFELIWGNVWEKMKESTQSELDAMEDIVSNSLDKMADIFSKVDSLYSMAEQNRMQNLQNMLTDLQNQQDKLEKEASDSGRKLTKNEKDELQRRQDLYEEQIERQEELIKQEQERQFERQKAFSIAEATIQGIQAAVKSFSDNGGWPWGLVAAGLSATFTAAQIAMIKAQPMPSYAQGAYELPEDQTAQVHKGEMIVPKPFAEELRDKGGLGGEITVNVYGASEDATVENTVDSDGMQQLDIFVSGKVKGMVMRGELDAVLQSRYTLQRNGKRG